MESVNTKVNEGEKWQRKTQQVFHMFIRFYIFCIIKIDETEMKGKCSWFWCFWILLGWDGVLCDRPCADGSFGIACEGKCQCVNNAACNPQNGEISLSSNQEKLVKGRFVGILKAPGYYSEIYHALKIDYICSKKEKLMLMFFRRKMKFITYELSFIKVAHNWYSADF